MKFSFITCTYNRAKQLPQTLRAVCEQDFPADNYEIVVVDNNSTDQTTDVCAEFAAKYTGKQFRYFREEQQGFSFALNRGIKEAKGEFLIFADDDETVNPDHLTRLDAHLKRYPQALLAASPVVPVYETTPKWMSHFTKRLIGGYFNQGQEVKQLGFKNYPGTGHTIIKRELYEQFGYYNTELGRKGNSLIGAEDKDMFLRLHNNNIICYYFPDIPIYHHIPQSKLTGDYFRRLTHSIGVSERIRTKAISSKAYYKRLLDEGVKWGASLVLCVLYTLALTPAKGLKLIKFRYQVTKGLATPPQPSSKERENNTPSFGEGKGEAVRYAVIGSGAIGGYYGGMLAKAGKEVHFLFHSDYDEVKKNGFSIDSINGDFTLNPVLAYQHTADMPPCDVVFVCLKSTNNHLLKTMLPPLLHTHTLVVMIQNGLGVEEALQADFPSLSIAGGMAFICSNKTAAGRVAHLAYGKLSIGLHSATGQDALQTVVSDLMAAGVETELVDLPVARWKKLVWNIPYNGMTVVLNTTTDKLMNNPHTRRLIYEMMQEVIGAGNKVANGNWSIDESFADKMLEMTDSMVPYSPSMKLDFDARRPMEINYIYSQPVIAARNAGFDMPRTAMLEKQLQFIAAEMRDCE